MLQGDKTKLSLEGGERAGWMALLMEGQALPTSRFLSYAQPHCCAVPTPAHSTVSPCGDGEAGAEGTSTAMKLCGLLCCGSLAARTLWAPCLLPAEALEVQQIRQLCIPVLVAT